jgi:hypothetical protein
LASKNNPNNLPPVFLAPFFFHQSNSNQFILRLLGSDGLDFKQPLLVEDAGDEHSGAARRVK